MTDDREKPDDVSAMMEALWGPRTEAPAHLGSGPGRSSHAGQAADGARPVVPALAERPRAPSHEATRSEPGGPEGRHAQGEDGFHGQLAVLRSELTAAVAAVEGRLNQRMDAVIAETHQASAGPDANHAEGDIREEIALIEAWERESDERLATLEEAVGSKLKRLSLAIETSHAESAATADLDVLRSEVAERIAASLNAVEARMVVQADLAELRADLRAEMVEQLRLVLQEALKQGEARATAVAAEVGCRQDAMVDRDDFAVLRSELKDELSRHMSAAQTELQRRVALLDAAIADARAQVGERLNEMAALVSAEAARAAEQAAAQVGIATAPLHGGLRALQEQIQQISAVVAALQRRIPAP